MIFTCSILDFQNVNPRVSYNDFTGFLLESVPKSNPKTRKSGDQSSKNTGDKTTAIDDQRTTSDAPLVTETGKSFNY